jgi:hypothetical protein
MADLHIDELAELYALGVLAQGEVDTVELHIAQCTTCARRVGEAEETVLALERGYRAQQPPDAPGWRLRLEDSRPALWRIASAVAAGIVIGIGIMLSRGAPAGQSQALNAMIHSHFSHAQFAPLVPGAPDAKVIYARDRTWLYVIATGRETYEVDAVSGASRTVLGVLRPQESVSTLFVDERVTAVNVEILDHGRVVDRAALR